MNLRCFSKTLRGSSIFLEAPSLPDSIHRHALLKDWSPLALGHQIHLLAGCLQGLRQRLGVRREFLCLPFSASLNRNILHAQELSRRWTGQGLRVQFEWLER